MGQFRTLSFISRSRVPVILVALLAGMFLCTGENEIETEYHHNRLKRQAECTSSDVYWNYETTKCSRCQCPSGQQIRGQFCGYGTLVGDPGCEDCVAKTSYRDRTDSNHMCRPCSICDPDASIVSECTVTTDRSCLCNKTGMGSISGHCVSCHDYPHAMGCPAAVTTPATLQINETTSGKDDPIPQTECGKKTDWGLVSGMILLGLCLAFVIGVLCGPKIMLHVCIGRGNKKGTADKGTDLQIDLDRSSSEEPATPPIGEYQRHDSRETAHISTPPGNEALSENGEATALLHQNEEPIGDSREMASISTPPGNEVSIANGEAQVVDTQV